MSFLHIFKISLRSLSKFKLYSIINISGFSIAIAFALLAAAFISDEYSFDQFHQNKANVYRINSKQLDGMRLQNNEKDPYRYSAYLPNGLIESIREQFKSVKYATTFKNGGNKSVRYNDIVLSQNILFTDEFFPKIFSFESVAGSTYNLFKRPTDIALTPEVAVRFFGNEDPIGKTIYIDDENLVNPAFTVTSILKCPANSSIQFSILLPLAAYKPYQKIAWNIYSYPTFVQLESNTNPTDFQQSISKLIEQNRGQWLQSFRDYYKIKSEITVEDYTLTPLTEIHFNKKVPWTKVSDPTYSWILACMAGLILSIASINYISFALTISGIRRKEIGIRKTIGATQFQIFKQFNTESIVLCFISSIAGCLLAMLLMPLFNYFAQKQITFSDINTGILVGFLILVSIITALLSGSYPSLLVSRINPVRALKGGSFHQPGFVRPLMVVQFIMSAFLVVASVIMYRQMNFIATKDLGYSGSGVIALPTGLGWSGKSDQAIERFREATKNNPDILEVSGSSGSFIAGSFSKTFKYQEQEHRTNFCRVDPHYLPLLNIELIEGRNFDSEIPGDSSAIIVNEALVKDMGWTNPLEERYNPGENDSEGHRIIGVVKDYHFESLEHEIEPMFLSASASSDAYLITLIIKLNTINLPQALSAAEKEWKKLYPDKPFDYQFVDDEVGLQYYNYNRWMNIAATTAVIALFIAGFGLFGLSGVNVAMRTKEIGIRKVLGASLTSLFVLVNRPFVIMAVAAFIIATPISWYFMNQWIVNFHYHIEIGWEIFLISSVAGLLIALISVTYHAINTANINPSETLRTE